MKSVILIGSCALIVALAAPRAEAFNPLESENSDVKKGNALLATNEIGDALAAYDEAARSLPGRNEIHLNRGLALSRSGEEQIDQAMQAFNLASDGSGTDGVRARAHSNLGNLFYKKEDYKAAIEHYKKSLMLQPGNKDTAWNLEMAKAQKKKQDEQQKENQDQEQNQDGDEQDQDQDQEQQQGDNQDQEQNQDQKQQEEPPGDKEEQDKGQQDQKDQQQQPEDQQQRPQPQPKTQQEMQQILDSLENGEDNLAKEKAKKQPMFIPRGGYKDW